MVVVYIALLAACVFACYAKWRAGSDTRSKANKKVKAVRPNATICFPDGIVIEECTDAKVPFGHRVFKVRVSGWRRLLAWLWLRQRRCAYRLQCLVLARFSPLASVRHRARMGMPPLHCVTNREDKFREFQLLLPSAHLIQARNLELATLEHCTDLVLLSVFRVLKAHSVLGASCFLDECSMDMQVEGYARKNPFPGHLHRQVMDQMGKPQFAKLYDKCPATTNTALAYTSDGLMVHVFTGSVQGHVHNPSRWTEQDGWDPLFYPNGYDQSLAELRNIKHALNMRQLPCAELLSMLFGTFTGVYEIHITAFNASHDDFKDGRYNPLHPSEEYLEKWRAACREIGVKPLDITMDHPRKPRQIQTACYYAFPNYAAAQTFAFDMVTKLEARGIPCLRVRIEAMLHNRECPRADAEALVLEEHYYEFHMRLGLPQAKTHLLVRPSLDPSRASDSDSKSSAGGNDNNNNRIDSNGDRRQREQICELAFQRAQTIAATLSTQRAGDHARGCIDPKISRVNGQDRIFANMRCYRVGSETALDYWARLKAALIDGGFTIAKEVRPEYCVFDDRPLLDDQMADEDQDHVIVPLPERRYDLKMDDT